MKRRLLSVLLVLSMMLSMVPVSVSAEGTHVKGTHESNAVCQKCKTAKNWTAWPTDGTVPTTGHYYLTGDISLSSQLLASDLCLCLNGYTITGVQNNKTFAVAASGKYLAIMDCTATYVEGVYTAGSITGGKNTTSAGGTVYVGNANNSFYFCSGVIENNQAYAGGGGIAIANGSASSCGKVYMSGGEIRGNYAKDASGNWKAGGGVQVGNYGQFFHTGGKITGNEAKLGGGIYTGTNVTVAVKNTSITGNHATESGGGVYFNTGTLSLQQAAKIIGNTAVDKNTANNVYLRKDYAGVTANGLTSGAEIGVSLAADRIAAGQMHVTTVHSGNNASYFTSDSSIYEPAKENNQIVLKVKPFEHEHCACGLENCSDASHGGKIAYSKWDQKTSLPSSGEICLTEHVELSGQVILTGDLKICLHDKNITGLSDQRILASVSGHTLTISDCQAGEDGQGNYTAGKLTSKVAATNGQGGAIHIGPNDTLYLYDGMITGNRSYVRGGGVNLSGTMYMYDGEISDNKALDGNNEGKAGGGICLDNDKAKLYIYGGTIKNNEAKLGAGIYCDKNATVELGNVTITGNTVSETAGGVYMSKGSLSVKGQTKITGNTVNGAAQNLVLYKAVTGINANELSGDAKIGVTLAADRIGDNNMNITTGCSGQLAGFFESDDAELTVAQNTEVYLKPSFEHSHCACGEKDCTAHGGQIEYLKWSKTDSLPSSGKYCLTENVQLTGQTVLTGDLSLCLHGKTVKGFEGGRILASVSGYTLTISDCQAKTDADGNYTAGQLTGAVNNASSNSSGGAIYIGANDKLYLYDGIITGNQSYSGGGGIQVGGTMYMYGGQIRGNQVLGGELSGGGINVAKTGKAYLYGGEICGNEARIGAGIYCLGSELVLSGVKIINNKSTEKAGGIFLFDQSAIKLAGNVQILGNTAAGKAANLVLPDKVTLSLDAMGKDAKVAVNATAFRYITGETADCSAAFQSDVTSLDVIYKDGKLFMDAADGHKHCVCTAAAAGCDHSAIKWAPWEASDELPSSGNYYLTKDVTVVSQKNLDGTELNLCLNGYTIKVTKGRAFYLKGNAKLSITDCTGKGIITGANSGAIMTENKAAAKAVVNIFGGTFKDNSTSTAGGALAVQGGGILNVYGGLFEGNSAIGKLKVDAQGNPVLDDKGNQQADNAIGGGAISMYGEDTVLNIYGGTFKNNKAVHVEVKDKAGSVSNKGGYGIIYIQGQANVYGGSFTGGEALLGGAFFVTGQKAVLNIHDAQITGNTAKGGGAVVLQSGATINIKGGDISNNTCAGAGGGAIYVSANSTLNITAGKITGNSAPGNGGALYISEGTANLLGGEISGNTAGVNGGGVYVNRATAIFNGTAVKNNTAKNNGGAVYGAGAALIRIEKSTISGNTAKNGGGIYATQNVLGDTTLYSTVVVNKGAVISGNKGEVNGGGIMLVGKESVLDINGGTITGNSAKNGGGVLAQTSSTVNFAGGTITGNKASVGGGGMYISADTKLNMTGGTITKNDAANNGGGMLVQRGIATIKGGSISGNTATTAAGVYFAGAKADIYNISITGNTAGKNCGGMMLGANEYTQNGVKMTAVPVVNMYGGSISGNAAPKANAGGVLLQSKGSTLNLKGGSITGNTCAVGGGAIYVASGTILNMTGGTITGNEAKQAGAIFCQKGTATITGGQIYGNTATAIGGALLVNGDVGVMTVKNLDIHSNTAPSAGAVEAQNFGTINMENCKVRDNASENMAGGIYIDKVSFGNLKDVQIYGNTCSGGGGGGMALAVGATVKADNITVENNRAEGIGGGIYNRGRLELNDSVVRANSTSGNGGGIGTFKTSSIPLSVDAGLFVKNSTITDNQAVKGAGLYLHVGCISELTDVLVEKNESQGEGSGIFSVGQTTLNNVTVTGNTSKDELYALYFDASLYDGHTYYTGKKVLQGKIVVQDNQGGEAYLGEGTAIAIPGQGLADGTYLPITLHSGLLTQQVIGIYNYEGENLSYIITAGDRSVTDPEKGAKVETQAQSGDWILYGVIGLFVAAIVAVVILVIAKKKKKTPVGEQE